jgi:hypothetical protein
MPGPPKVTPPPQRLYSTNEFASALRELYPGLAEANFGDDELTHAVVATHPGFKGKVVDVLEGAEAATLPAGFDYKIQPPPAVDMREFDPMAKLADDWRNAGDNTPLMQAYRGAKKVVTGDPTITPRVTRNAKGESAYEQPQPTAHPRWQGVADIADAVMEAAVPGMIPLAGVAPLASALGLGAGFAGDTVARTGAEALGADPTTQRLAGLAGGTLAGIAGGGYGHYQEYVKPRRQIYEQLAAEDAAFRADQARQAVFDAATRAQQEARAREPFQYLDTIQQYKQQFTAPPPVLESIDATGQRAPFMVDPTAAPEAAPVAGLLPPRRFYAPPAMGDMGAEPFDYLRSVVTPEGPIPEVPGIPPGQMLAPPPPTPPAWEGLVDGVVDAAAQGLGTPDAPRLVTPPGWEPQLSLTAPTAVGPDGLPVQGALPFRQRRARFGEGPEAVLPGGAPDTGIQPRLHLREVVDQERDPIIMEEVRNVLHELRMGPRPSFEELAGEVGGPAANPKSLFELIAKYGGLGDDDVYAGEIARLWEMADDGLLQPKAGAKWNTRGRKHVAGQKLQNLNELAGDGKARRRAQASVGGVRGVLKNELPALELGKGGARRLDHMAELLRSEPGFEHIDGPNALLDAMERALVDLRKQATRPRVEAVDHPEVFWDIAKEGPSSVPSKRALEAGIEDFLNGKRNIWGARAYKIARQRLESRQALDDYRSGPPPGAGGEAGVQGRLPYTAESLGAPDDLPEFLRELTPEDVPGGWDEDGPRALTAPPAVDAALPGLEGVRSTEVATPAFEAPFSLTGEAATGTDGVQRSMWDRLKGEEGHLILNVKPSNRRGMRDWLDRHADEYGAEDWFQQAYSALEGGETETAWRIAAIAAARTTGRGAAADVFNRDKVKADIEAQLGKALPKGVEVGEGGVLKMPSNPGGLDVKFSDVTLGKNLLDGLMEHVDPTTIMRVTDESGKVPYDLPHELRITAQMADQMLRDFPEEALAELGLSPAEMAPEKLAAHFDRAFSNAGKVLNLAKQWQDANWDSLLHLDPVTGSTRGPGAAGRLEFLPQKTQEAFLRWLEKATPEQQAEIGFTLPKDIPLDSPKGKARARAFFQKQAALNELDRTFERIAGESNALNKATVWAALNKREKSAILLDAVENTSRAFLISKPTTAIRNTWSQSMRYSVGVVDELLSGAAATLLLDPTEAGIHFTRAKELTASLVSRKNSTVPTGLRKDFGAESLEALYEFTTESVKGLPAKDARKFLSVLGEFPQQAARFMGSLSLEEAARPPVEGVKGKALNILTNQRLRNVVTVANRLQEYSFRTTVFDAMMREQIRTLGHDPDVLLAGDPKRLVETYGSEQLERMIGTAVSASLDYTFAANPLPGSPQAGILQFFNSFKIFSPFMRLGMPFPRFNWVSAPRFLYDHSPAALLDIPAKVLFNSGRLARGMELKAIETQIIPDLVREISTAKYTRETSYQAFLQNQVEAQAARKAWRALEARAEKQGSLQGLEAELTQHAETVQNRLTRAAEARAEYREAQARVKRLEKQRVEQQGKAQEYKEIGAPSAAEYLARQATGMGIIFPLAYMLRDSEGAKDTKWYEYRADVPGAGPVTLDFRPFGPFVQYLLIADVVHDVVNGTDWDGWAAEVKQNGLGYGSLVGAMSKHYKGKYTGGTFAKEFTQAFLSISPAAGSTAAIMDYMMGRTGSGTSWVDNFVGGTLGMLGQFAARFTVPLQTLNDIHALWSDEAKQARIPEENTPEDLNAGSLLFGPTAANIPGVREALIPPRVNPLTGEPTETELPVTRLFTGMNSHTSRLLEQQLAHTGLEYGKAVPRKTGDREFDNKVASAYGSLVSQYLPELLAEPEYQAMPPELQRDVLGPVLSALRRAAFGQMLQTVSDDEASRKAHAPAERAKAERWQRYVETLSAEEGPEPAEVEQPAGEPGAIGPPPVVP